MGGDKLKQSVARQLVDQGLHTHDAIISFQVMQEFLNVATRKSRVRMSPADGHYYLQHVLMPLCAVVPGEDLYHEALSITDATGWSFYDSLIVSAAGCQRVLSEGLQHGRTIHHFKEVMRGVLAVPKKRLDELVREAKENSPLSGDPHAWAEKIKPHKSALDSMPPAQPPDRGSRNDECPKGN